MATCTGREHGGGRLQPVLMRHPPHKPSVKTWAGGSFFLGGGGRLEGVGGGGGRPWGGGGGGLLHTRTGPGRPPRGREACQRWHARDAKGQKPSHFRPPTLR